MKMAIGSDGVRAITEAISEYLEEKGVELVRCGALAGEKADYVDSARAVAGSRAALCVDAYSAQIARLANNANVLVLSMRYTGEGLAKEIVDAWLATSPSDEPRRKVFHRKTDELDDEFRR